MHYRFQEYRFCLFNSLFKCQGSRDFKCHFVGVNIMVRAIIKLRLDIHNFASRERSFFHGLDQAFFNSRNIVLRNRAAKQRFCELKFLFGR